MSSTHLCADCDSLAIPEFEGMWDKQQSKDEPVCKTAAFHVGKTEQVCHTFISKCK